MDERTLARFWAKVDKNGPVPAHKPELGPCWLWTAGLEDGYGRFHYQRKDRRAHRFAYELLADQIPPGLTIDHLCHNGDPLCEGGSTCQHRRCVNPAHLDPCTSADNCRRSLTNVSTINSAKETCPAGHLYEGQNLRTIGSHRKCKTCEGWQGLPPPAERTQCPARHEYTPENTLINKRGQRSCKKCQRKRTREYLRKRRAAAKAARAA